MKYHDPDEPDKPEEETLMQGKAEFVWFEKR